MKRFIDNTKKQFKANLHCHTILSDGKWTPEKVKEEYKKRGYSVIAITDHEHLVPHNDLTDNEILFITAYEAYIRNFPFDAKLDGQSHINFYSKTPENKLVYYTPDHTKYIGEEELKTLQYHHYVEHREFSVEFLRKMIEDAHKAGFLSCHNHPTWSFEDESYADAYANCLAMELHNYSSYNEGHNEFNEHYYEYQLNKGRRLGVIAADDNHNFRDLNDAKQDSFGGFTYILSDRLDYGSIIKAMENKDFYASCGPQIFSLTMENGTLSVKTSNAKRIAFITNARHRGVFLAGDNEYVTEGTFTPIDKDNWVYVEVTDEKGKKAFSRAIFKDEFENA